MLFDRLFINKKMVWVKFKKSNFIAYSKIKNKIVIKRTWNKYEEKKIELNGLKF